MKVQFLDYVNGTTSESFGPYEEVQLTYGSIRVDHDTTLAFMDADEMWQLQNGDHFSDVVIG